MTHTSHTENILDNVKTFILANLQTYLSGILVLKADSKDVSLDMFEDETITIGSNDANKYDGSPIMLINPMESKFEYLTLGQDKIEVLATISIIVGGDKEETLTKQCMRYGAALRNMIRANITFGNTVDEISVDTIIYVNNILGAPELSAVNVNVNIINDINN